MKCYKQNGSMHIHVGWLCFTSHRQRGHLETAPPFTVSCEGCGAQFLHHSCNFVSVYLKKYLLLIIEKFHKNEITYPTLLMSTYKPGKHF